VRQHSEGLEDWLTTYLNPSEGIKIVVCARTYGNAELAKALYVSVSRTYKAT